MSVPPEMRRSCTSCLMRSVDEVEALGQSGEPVERMARSAERSCVRRAPGPPSCTASIYLALVPKMVTRSSLRDVPQPVGPGCERRAVEQDQRRLAGQPDDQPVPHHPAAGGEVEEAVARAHVAVEAVLLEVLQERAAGAVHDGLGLAGGARGVEDVERVIERELRECQGLPGRRQVVRPEVTVRDESPEADGSRKGTTTVRARSAGHARSRPPWPGCRSPCRHSSSRRPR